MKLKQKMFFTKTKNLFDFSDYPLYSKFFDPVNKKFIGKMKDEFKERIISEFVGLKSKMYPKGVNKKIKHKEFVYVLSNRKVMRHNMKRIQNRFYKIGTYNVCKISLSYFDDKRYVLDDGVNSLAYFHKDIKN